MSAADRNQVDTRFPVQWVHPSDERRVARFPRLRRPVAGGVFKPGDEVAVPSGRKSKVKSVVTFDGELSEAFQPDVGDVTLEDEIDVSRGDMIARVKNAQPKSRRTSTR